MPQINFYLIAATHGKARLAFVCRLIEKIYKKAHQIYIHTENHEQAKTLDQLLWSERADSFIPHQLSDEAPLDVPIVIGWDTLQPRSHDTLINLAEATPAFAGEFHKIAEVISQEPEVLAHSRQRYRDYQSQGYEIIIHDLKQP